MINTAILEPKEIRKGILTDEVKVLMKMEN